MPTYDTRIVPSGDRFDIDTTASVGLTLRLRGGAILGAGYRNVPNREVTLEANASNYVQITTDGVVVSNSTGWVDGLTQLYLLGTDAGYVTSILDYRGGSQEEHEFNAIAADLEERTGIVAGAAHDISMGGIRTATGDVITSGSSDGEFNTNVTDDVLTLRGRVANNGTEVTVGTFQFTLPPNYEAGAPVALAMNVNNIGAGTQTSCTITVEAWEADLEGGKGANLGPAAQTHEAKATWYAKSFTITPTTLLPGSVLFVKVTVENVESGAGNLVWHCARLAMLCDVWR